MPIVVPPAGAVLPFATPVIADALARLRQDIFDQAGPSPRWQDSDLLRAIDRALDQYSFVAPWVQTVLLPAVAGSRLYAAPASTAAGPPWWVETVEYPTGRYPRAYVPFQEMAQPSLGIPPAPLSAPSGVFGALNGAYLYRVTFLGVTGETLSSTAAAVSVTNSSVNLTLPLGPVPYCQGRRLYRTAAGGVDGMQLLAATIPDNTTASYTDTLPDAGLGTPLPTADSTLNGQIVELNIPDSQLPGTSNTQGVPGNVAIAYAGKHAWSAAGTTIPEQHHDIVLLGAAAYACLAVQVPTNDLFEYQDGELRDRVDETKAPEHWLAAGNNLLGQFMARLEAVKRQRDAGYAATARWGSVPTRWQWT